MESTAMPGTGFSCEGVRRLFGVVLDLRDRLQMEPEAEIIADNFGVADFRVRERKLEGKEGPDE